MEILSLNIDSNKQIKLSINQKQKLEKAVEDRTRQIEVALERERELSELKSKFISIACHEFRTPLSAILSSASLIDRYIKNGQTEAQKKHTERIRMSARHLNDLLTDFLSLEKLEEGMLKNRISEIDLKSLIDEVIQEVDGIRKPSQCIISKFDLTSTLVLIDQKILYTILINLLSNAIKYSRKHTKIYIVVKQKSDRLTIEVRDQGIGIPVDEQPQLFSRFFRATNVRGIQGTGLGLNIVKKYTEIIGGSITFDSTPGEGTTFKLSIPIDIKLLVE